MVVRKETYFKGDKEITKDEWYQLLEDENNLESLTIKYEEVKDIDYLCKIIDELKKEISDLKYDKNNKWNWEDIFKKTPITTYPTINKPDWTFRPENSPVYFTTTSSFQA